MSFGAYVFLMLMGTALSWSAWYLVLSTVNPEEAGALGLALFYVTLIVSLIGTLSLIELLSRKLFSRQLLVPAREVRTSIRHGILLSLITAASLALTSQGVFTWWALLILLVTAGTIEFISLIMNKSRRD